MRPRRHAGPVFVAELRTSCLLDLGLTDYLKTYGLQQELVENRRSGSLSHDLFLMTEHPATFTLGRRGGRENLVVTESFLSNRNIPIVHIERGGDITYHGPGQLVLYPIFDLRKNRISVGRYVTQLEEVMLLLAARFGVDAVRDSRNYGIWVKEKKLGSVGIAIRHGVSFHGLALNVSVDLEPFSWVNPCGLKGVSMTSLSAERNDTVELEDVKTQVQQVLSQVFSRDIKVVTEVLQLDTVQS